MMRSQPVATMIEPAAPAAAAPSRHRWATLVDRTGATASLLCAVHCALLPFVLALLPLVGLAFLGGALFERLFVTGAALLAATSLTLAYRTHRRPHALFVMVPGVALLLFGIFTDVHAHVVMHTASVVTGGVMVACAHVTNLVFARRHHRHACAHAPDPTVIV